jgi:hypothetical protein
MNKFFESFVPEKVQAVLMQIGEHDVMIKSVKEVTDHVRDLSGTAKENYRFADVHDQVAFTFVNIDGTPGIITERFNTLGFERFDEMSPAKQKKYTKDPEKGYAIDSKGKRVISAVRTEQCKSVLNGFLNQLSTADGKLLIDEIAGKPFSLDALAGARCRITVAEKAYNGEVRNRITKYRRITAKPVLANVAGADGAEQVDF